MSNVGSAGNARHDASEAFGCVRILRRSHLAYSLASFALHCAALRVLMLRDRRVSRRTRDTWTRATTHGLLGLAGCCCVRQKQQRDCVRSKNPSKRDSELQLLPHHCRCHPPPPLPPPRLPSRFPTYSFLSFRWHCLPTRIARRSDVWRF